MEGAVETRPELGQRARALSARTMCEAFQLTAAEHSDDVALRTIADGVSITFVEYAERVRRYAGALHALGVRRADTVGFMLTNRPECRGIDQVARPDPGGAVVSFLPHAHIADRGLSHYGQMAWGYTVTCCPDLTQVFAHVADCRPTFFGGVPRIWEKLKAALEAAI